MEREGVVTSVTNVLTIVINVMLINVYIYVKIQIAKLVEVNVPKINMSVVRIAKFACIVIFNIRTMQLVRFAKI